MGLGNSKYYDLKEYDKNMGYIPRRLEEENCKYKPSEIQYIVGDGRLLQFNTENYTLSRVNVSQL